MIKNVFKLTNILLKDSVMNQYVANKKNGKINKKSFFGWLVVILTMIITYVSFEIIKVLAQINQPTIFLNSLFLIMDIIMIFQVILSSTNIYFFSSDLDILLPLPIKSEELLLAKFNVILRNLYFTEFIFALFPLMIYGNIVGSGIMFYLYVLIVLLFFPILINFIVSIIMMFAVKLSKFVKNKDVFQIIITLIFILFMCFIEFKGFNTIAGKLENNLNFENEQIMNFIYNFNEKLQNISKYFLNINPCVELLNNSDKLFSVMYLLKIIFIELIFLFLFIFIGKKYYLKNILSNKKYSIFKKVDEEYIEKKSRKKSVKRAYLEKEFKMLFRNPIFFIQCVFPSILLMVSIIVIVIISFPNLKAILQSDLFDKNMTFSVDLSVICLILGIIQIIFTLSNISISAISREGKNILYMKFLPIDFLKQFFYKAKLQIFLNNILIIFVLIIVKLIFPEFGLLYLLFLFVLSNLLDILDSHLMLLLDLYKPNLHWKSDYEAIKNNGNKLFQYILTIVFILLIVYFYKIFNDVNLCLACFFMILILIISILILNKFIKVNINKLFKKIN